MVIYALEEKDDKYTVVKYFKFLWVFEYRVKVLGEFESVHDAIEFIMELK